MGSKKTIKSLFEEYGYKYNEENGRWEKTDGNIYTYAYFHKDASQSFFCGSIEFGVELNGKPLTGRYAKKRISDVEFLLRYFEEYTYSLPNVEFRIKKTLAENILIENGFKKERSLSDESLLKKTEDNIEIFVVISPIYNIFNFYLRVGNKTVVEQKYNDLAYGLNSLLLLVHNLKKGNK